MGGREPAAEFRTTTVERALAEQPSGLTLHALVQRLAPHFDVGDVLVVLRRRPDVFLQWDGRWLSRAASLDQPPRRLRCDFDYEAIPSEWQVFANPWGAANGWRTYHHQLQENAFDPQTAHIKVVPERGPFSGLGLHVDHTILLGRAAWVIWCVVLSAPSSHRAPARSSGLSSSMLSTRS